MEIAWVTIFNRNAGLLDAKGIMLYGIAALFLVTGVLFIVILFASRIIKSRLEQRRNWLRSNFQQVLNKVIVNETFNEKGNTTPAFEFYMAQLRLLIGSSSFAKRILIGQILEIRKSLTGTSAEALVRTYHALHLQTESLNKLKSLQWPTKASGVRELAEMNYHGSVQPIREFLQSGNRVLREESFMALVRLENEPLSFLDDFKGELSLWMRINIYRYLSKLDARNLPVFSRWFHHPNIAVRLFSLSMARQFRQTASVSALAEMVYDANPKVVGIAVSALGELEAYQYRDRVAKLATHAWNFEKLSRRVVNCLGKIGDPKIDADLIGEFIQHPCHAIRFEAVRALKQLGQEGERVIDMRIESNTHLRGILKHISEPLLSAR